MLLTTLLAIAVIAGFYYVKVVSRQYQRDPISNKAAMSPEKRSAYEQALMQAADPEFILESAQLELKNIKNDEDYRTLMERCEREQHFLPGISDLLVAAQAKQGIAVMKKTLELARTKMQGYVYLPSLHLLSPERQIKMTNKMLPPIRWESDYQSIDHNTNHWKPCDIFTRPEDLKRQELDVIAGFLLELRQLLQVESTVDMDQQIELINRLVERWTEQNRSAKGMAILWLFDAASVLSYGEQYFVKRLEADGCPDAKTVFAAGYRTPEEVLHLSVAHYVSWPQIVSSAKDAMMAYQAKVKERLEQQQFLEQQACGEPAQPEQPAQEEQAQVAASAADSLDTLIDDTVDAQEVELIQAMQQEELMASEQAANQTPKADPNADPKADSEASSEPASIEEALIAPKPAPAAEPETGDEQLASSARAGGDGLDGVTDMTRKDKTRWDKLS